MHKCINLGNSDFQALVKETKIDAISLAAEISLWQEINNTDEYPTVEYLQANTSLPYNDAVPEFKSKYHIKEIYSDVNKVNEILKSARDNTKYDQIQFGVKSSSSGFSIAYNPKYGTQVTLLQQYDETQAKGTPLPELETAVNNYFEVIGTTLTPVSEIYFHGERVDAIAKANTLTNTVEFVEEKLRRDTLPEEAAHIWVDMAGGESNPMILKMMNDVTKYKIYADVVRQYSKDYKGNDILLRKEAVGKVIASHMVGNFTGEPTLDELGAKWYQLLWNKIKSFFVGNKYKNAAFEILNITKEKAEKLQRPTTGSELMQLDNEQPSEESQEEPEEIIHKTQYVYFKRRIAFLESKLKDLVEDSPEHTKMKDEINTIKDMFDTAQETQDYTELGSRTIDKVEKFVERLKDSEDRNSFDTIESTLETVEAFKQYPGLEERANKLEKELIKLSIKPNLKLINEFRTETDEITLEMIDKQTEDINQIVQFGTAVANSSNYIVRTIGAITKDGQNRYSYLNKLEVDKIKKAVDKLEEWGKAKGMTLNEVYDIFIQEKYESLVLTQKRLENGDINPNWNKIQKDPVLKEFYQFFITKTGEGGKKTQTKTPYFFIPNVKKKTTLYQRWKAEDIETEESSVIFDEELFADLVSNKAYRSKLSPEEKSKDLEQILIRYMTFANRYDVMSKILPQARVLQKMLEYKITKNGEVTDRMFTKISTKDKGKKVAVKGKDSNRYKMVDDYIEMQIKGKAKLNQQYSEVVDQLLMYNSVLRIGLSPITAISNVVFGDISNIIEGVGGRFYTVKDLHNASTIFSKETWNKDSKMNKLLEIIAPLQEMSDYEQLTNRGTRKLSPDKIKEILFSPQKIGEKYLQTRTMIALMLHEKIKSIDGKSEISLWEMFNEDGTIKEGFEYSEKDISRLRDKVQRLNEMIHGRYSSRDASIASNHLIGRLLLQFKKWIPTQIENRMIERYYDARLGVEFEGRYKTLNRTFLRTLFKEKQVGKAFSNLILPLISTKKALESGNMSEMEIYNMRKNMIEIIVVLGTILLLAGLDDDEMKKNPSYKFGMTLLNRASSEMSFFYNASELAKLGENTIPLSKTIGDLIDVATIIPEVLYTGDTVITRGSNKGRYKIEKEVIDVVPILNPLFGQMRRIFSENALEELQ
jgi:hypothetical protein